MTGATDGPAGGPSGMDQAQMQLRITGVREALDEVRRRRAQPKFRHVADLSILFPDGNPPAAPD